MVNVQVDGGPPHFAKINQLCLCVKLDRDMRRQNVSCHAKFWWVGEG